MGLELKTDPPQKPHRPRISAGAWRVMSDGMSPPGIKNPMGETPRARAPMGIDHWMKRDRGFRFTQNQAEVFVDGKEAWPAMEKLLREAKSSIRFDFYIFSGEQAARLAEIMVERRKAGVDVRVQLDPHHGEIELFSHTEEQVIAYLKANGVQVDDYPLERIEKPKHQHEHIDHNKFLIVDGQRAMVGGMNIADPFLNNHDVMVKVRGPVVTDLKRQFDEVWKLGDEQAVDPQDGPEIPETGDATVRIVGTGPNRRTAESVLVEQLRKAKKRIYVQMFELTSARLIHELIAAKKRGVDVRVLSDPGDHGRFLGLPVPTGYPNLPNLYKLAGVGIQTRWYDLEPNQVHDHLKLSIIDDSAIVGSLNWTDSALGSNAETSLELRGGVAYGRVLQMFADDWNSHSRPVPEPDFYRRGLQTAISWAN